MFFYELFSHIRMFLSMNSSTVSLVYYVFFVCVFYRIRFLSSFQVEREDLNLLSFFIRVIFLYQEKRYILKRFSFYQKESSVVRASGSLYISYYVRSGVNVDRTAENLVYLGLAQI